MSKRQPPPSSIPPSRSARDIGERLRRKIGESRSGGYDLAVARTLQPGERVAGRYEIVRHIGRGAFCDVFEATDAEHGGAACAVKVPRAEARRSERIDARFRVEAQAASLLESPHTAPALDFGVLEDGRPFYVMEFLKGMSLAGWLARDRTVHPVHVAMAGVDILHALHEAHERTIVHRDIKPSNALLVQHPNAPRPYVRLIDFGIAKVLGGADWELSALDLTGGGRAPCTPLYAAPEQLKGVPTPRTDLYAVGMLLATMLDGTPPYGGLEGPDLVVAQLGDAPVPWGPRTQASALFPILEIACQKDATRRFDNATAMRRALRDVRARLLADGDAPPPLVIAEADLDFEGAGTTDVGEITSL